LTSRIALKMFDVADIWARRTGNQVRLVSANDHVHSRGSAHYAGLALDLHSSAPGALAGALRSLGYLVLWNVPGHFGHVHVQAPGSAQAQAGAASTVASTRRAAPAASSASPSR
jgi:hypothetical protein